MQGKLAVAATLNTQSIYNIQRTAAEITFFLGGHFPGTAIERKVKRGCFSGQSKQAVSVAGGQPAAPVHVHQYTIHNLHLIAETVSLQMENLTLFVKINHVETPHWVTYGCLCTFALVSPIPAGK